jgi:exodeoxyribonuclease V gamma subunit
MVRVARMSGARSNNNQRDRSMLYLYYGNRLEHLASVLAGVQARAASGDPLQPELVLVQNQGMAQWLTQQLAGHAGICANVEFLLPAEFGWTLYRNMRPELGKQSPFDRDVMAWRIMRELPDCLIDPVFAPLQRYLDADLPVQRRHQLAQQIADVYDQYLVYRPDWLAAWERGERLGLGAEEDWQAPLWQRLALAVPEPHRAQLWHEFMRLERLDQALEALPPRLTVFGISSLPPTYLNLLRRVAEQREVHFFWLNPCQEYWADLVSSRTKDRFESYWRRQGKPVPTEAMEEGNVLLASLGRQGRDAFALHWSLLLDTAGADDEAHFIETEPASCLQHIQHDILCLTERSREERRLRAAGHAPCGARSSPSPKREVQALYDQLLARFDADGTLTPRDMLIMAPDIEAYAPYIHAVFGAPEDESRRIPYSIADRTLQAESELVGAFLALLECERGRFTAPDMFDLLQAAPVRERFGLGKDELPQIEHWLRETGIRWGLDGDDRGRHGLPAVSEGTWVAGLQRLLLGYALPLRERGLYAGHLPYDGIEGGDAETAGKLLAFVEVLSELARHLRGERPVGAWCDYFSGALERFFDLGQESADDAYLIQSALQDLKESADQAGFQEAVPAAIIRRELGSALAQQSRGGSFLAGQVTFAGMVPMRALPFRFIGLLGLNDADYPRRRPNAGFDLMIKKPERGDRIHRDEDRYLFLEALLSARERLYLSYVGQNVRDNSDSQPSVILSELLDYLVDSFDVDGIQATDAGERREQLLAHWVRRHPLQPFSPRYFTAGKRLQSFSRRHCAVARALSQEKSAAQVAFFEKPLPMAEASWRQVSLEQLIRFFRHPARFLLAERLGVWLQRPDELMDRELFELDALQASLLRTRLLAEHQAGEILADRLAVHQARGVLPPGQMGEFVYQRLAAECEGFADRLLALAATPEPSISLDMELEHESMSFHLIGAVDGVTSVGRVDYRYAEMRGRDWLDFWISHLAFQLCRDPAQPGDSYWLDKKTMHRLGAMDAGQASARLSELLGLYWDGLQQPLPLFPETAWQYAEKLVDEGKEREEALEHAREAAWESNRFPESDDVVLQTAFRGRDPLSDEFRRIAELVFVPLLEHKNAALAPEEMTA